MDKFIFVLAFYIGFLCENVCPCDKINCYDQIFITALEQNLSFKKYTFLKFCILSFAETT